jgi:hypothetical protein
MTDFALGTQVRHRTKGWRGTISAILKATWVSGPLKPYVVRRVTAHGTAMVSCAGDEIEPLIDASFLSVEDTIDTAPSATVLPFARPKLRVIQGGGNGDAA